MRVPALSPPNEFICSEYDNSSVGEEEKFASRHVWAAFKDWQVSKLHH